MGRTVSLRSQEVHSTVPLPSESPIDLSTSQTILSHSSMANDSASVHEDMIATQPETTQPDLELHVQSHLNSTGVWLLAGQHLSR